MTSTATTNSTTAQTRTVRRFADRVALVLAATATTVSLSTGVASATDHQGGRPGASHSTPDGTTPSKSLQAATQPAPLKTQAAVATYGYARACFQAPYMGVYGAYNRTVFMDAWINGAWYQISSTTPGIDGCLTQALPTGYYWRFRVYYYEARTYYIGQSGYTWPVKGQTVNLGTVRLQTLRG